MNRTFLPLLLRKANLAAHVIFSVGWLGAVLGFLVLSVAGITSANALTVRSAYVSMNSVGMFAIVPLSIAALLTGLIQALGTEWGLFRYWWVFVKFLLTVLATALLLLHQFTGVANAARRVAVLNEGELPDLGRLGVQLVVDASLGILVLSLVTIISVFKPWGQIRSKTFSKEPGSTGPKRDQSRSISRSVVLATLAALAILVLAHLVRGGAGMHNR